MWWSIGVGSLWDKHGSLSTKTLLFSFSSCVKDRIQQKLTNMFFFLINRLYRVKLVSGEKDNLLPFSYSSFMKTASYTNISTSLHYLLWSFIILFLFSGTGPLYTPPYKKRRLLYFVLLCLKLGCKTKHLQPIGNDNTYVMKLSEMWLPTALHFWIHFPCLHHCDRVFLSTTKLTYMYKSIFFVLLFSEVNHSNKPNKV